MLQLLRMAVRTLLQNKGWTFVVVMSLGLGIGGTTTIFTVVNAVLLRPLPYRDSNQIVWVWSDRAGAASKERASYPDFLDWKAQSKTLDSWVAWGGYETILTNAGPPQRLQAALMSGSLFTSRCFADRRQHGCRGKRKSELADRRSESCHLAEDL